VRLERQRELRLYVGATLCGRPKIKKCRDKISVPVSSKQDDDVIMTKERKNETAVERCLYECHKLIIDN